MFLRLSTLPWPLPALITWAMAWAVLLLLIRVLPWWLALGMACTLSTAASLFGDSWWRRAMIAAGFPLSFAVMWASQLPAWGWLLPLGLLLLVYPLNAWRDAPVFPTPQHALRGLANVVQLPEQALVLDAGCGLGDGLRALRSELPQARLHGLEWSWPLRLVCALRCPWARVRRADIWLADWSDYQLVYLFQRPESMGRAAVKAATEMQPGSWLVSLDFALPGVTPTACLEGNSRHKVWIYSMPLEGNGQR
ncbi:class I SAM-dependent methyltransferase [Comamonas resistens]|uniref:Class I SAM-dependent methyltransferase n=1 Tax=Comamonas resistens TaxID=3046670 RepID=A0ABY8SWH3_9BURK|nr:class I SAM-dependent methyltransferase [Comamonas resistens]MDL5037188.1 class I SAM-dependent methyltransferase [Comamonas resistens]WHS65616.1 class I SAM-dependent methyltransferase [Comamonas resistens]